MRTRSKVKSSIDTKRSGWIIEIDANKGAFGAPPRTFLVLSSEAQAREAMEKYIHKNPKWHGYKKPKQKRKRK